MRISLPINLILLSCTNQCTILAVATACTRSDAPREPWLRAEVLYTSDDNCGKPVIIFSEDSSQIRKIKADTALRWLAIDLPTSLNKPGQKLYVDVDSKSPNPAIYCVGNGIAYNHLHLFHAKSR